MVYDSREVIIYVFINVELKNKKLGCVQNRSLIHCSLYNRH